MNRGGSWNNEAANCRSANRNRNTPENRNNNLGFRVALAQRHGGFQVRLNRSRSSPMKFSLDRRMIDETAWC